MSHRWTARPEQRGRTAVHLVEVGQLGKGTAVPERDVDDAVVGEGGEGVHDGRFLAAAGGTRGDEHAGKLAREGALGPEPACLVPERLYAHAGTVRH